VRAQLSLSLLDYNHSSLLFLDGGKPRVVSSEQRLFKCRRPGIPAVRHGQLPGRFDDHQSGNETKLSGYCIKMKHQCTIMHENTSYINKLFCFKGVMHVCDRARGDCKRNDVLTNVLHSKFFFLNELLRNELESDLLEYVPHLNLNELLASVPHFENL